MKKYKKATIIIVIFILCFIFINSIFSHNFSFSISDGIRKTVQSFIPYGKYKWLDYILVYALRKMAHFFEYFVLGMIITKFYIFKKNDGIIVQKCVNSVAFAFGIAFLDETIQIFSGRGSEVSDIWIDLFGAVSGILFTIFLKYLKDRKNKN